MSRFKCKFDENLLGFVKALTDLENLFQCPKNREDHDYFADDTAIEKIRGVDDANVVIAATKAERTIITNDVDFFLSAGVNTYGIIVLRGGIVENEVYKEFRNFKRKQKHEVVKLLFKNKDYLKEMERIRKEKSCELASLEQEGDKYIWTFRKPSREESDGFLTKKAERAQGRAHKCPIEITETCQPIIDQVA